MQESDKLLQSIEAIHTAGLDESLWPSALKSITDLIGGVGTTLESVDKWSALTPVLRVKDFWSHGIPAGSEREYADHYISISPRVVLGFTQRAGEIGYDYMLVDDAAIDRDPFYSEFMGPAGMRYFVSGTLVQNRQEYSCFAVQRSRHQGHVGKREIRLMEILTPHVQQALDVTRRLRGAARISHNLGHALDWLADGAALMRADGTLLYVNESLQAIARTGDGIRIGKENKLEFASADSTVRFNEALASACMFLEGEVRQTAFSDFVVPRPSGVSPYVVSIRPLFASGKASAREGTRDAGAIVFVRDPTQRYRTTVAMLREIFGFTEAEAALARALQTGTPLAQYARAHRLSLNTIYTHLRRIKEKTGCRRLPELTRKLNDIQIMLRR